MIEMGRENLDGIERTVQEHGIDCDFVRAGSFAVATQDYQVAPLREEYDETRTHGMATTWLSAESLRERVDSPTFLAGMHDPTPPSSSRPGWRGGCATRACAPAYASRSRHRSPRWPGRAPGSPYTPRTGGCRPSASYSPRTRTRRCCAGCG